MADEASRAGISGPESITTACPVATSVATALNGNDRSAKVWAVRRPLRVSASVVLSTSAIWRALVSRLNQFSFMMWPASSWPQI